MANITLKIAIFLVLISFIILFSQIRDNFNVHTTTNQSRKLLDHGQGCPEISSCSDLQEQGDSICNKSMNFLDYLSFYYCMMANHHILALLMLISFLIHIF